jgi:hypothetical protein
LSSHRNTIVAVILFSSAGLVTACDDATHGADDAGDTLVADARDAEPADLSDLDSAAPDTTQVDAVNDVAATDTVADSAGPDTVADTTSDAVQDTTAPDAVEVAAPDVVEDATPDAVPDAAPDAVPDATPDAIQDTAPDAIQDTAPDTSPDAIQDTAPDSGPDVTGTSTTAGIYCTYSQSVFNPDESVNATSTATWTCSATTRSLAANGLPDHEVGTFPNANNPNAITAQTVARTFPMAPAIVSATGTPTNNVAYCLNGVKFEVGTAGTCTDAGQCNAIGNGGAWHMEAVGAGSFDFGNDDSHGHVQPTGAYHYHGIPEGFLTELGNGQAVTLVGWAVDGFPVYARYGYSVPTDASSPIKVVTGSYTLKAVSDAGRPSTAIYPLGAFTQDWQYSAGSGDLDECNGRFGVTPEFPNGIYHYYLTDSFPYGQRCVKGTVAGGGGPGTVPTCAEVPAGTPCCGDGVCAGPKTKLNCPADCK